MKGSVELGAKQNQQKISHGYSITPGGPKVSYHELLNSTKLADRIVPNILQYIKDTGLREGDKLPPQKELCAMMGVGNCSLREALIVLQALGVLKSKHGIGWYIDRFEPKSSLGFLSPLLEKFAGISNIEQIMETRLVHEPLIAYKAAENISPEGLERLRQSLQRMKENMNKPGRKELRDADRDFHKILADECGNDVLSIISSIMSGLLFDTVMWVQSASNDDEVLLYHQQIYDSVVARDSKGAARAMKQHLIVGWRFLHANHIIQKEFVEESLF
jgi:GntR family transcriptional regulator, transcriptional repressor for pyruvate dehydrogenase complex